MKKKKVRKYGERQKKMKPLSGWGNISNVHTLLLLQPPFICLSDPIKKVWKHRETSKKDFWLGTPEQMYYSPPQCTTTIIIDCVSVRNSFLPLDGIKYFLGQPLRTMTDRFWESSSEDGIGLSPIQLGHPLNHWTLFLSDSHSLLQRGVFVEQKQGKASADGDKTDTSGPLWAFCLSHLLAGNEPSKR